jgi:hypothetical protein
MFYAPGLIFGKNVGVGSRFHVLRTWTRFWRRGGRRVPFSSFALPDSFSAVLRASGLVFMFCAPVLIFGCIVDVMSRFHGLRFPELVFGRTEGVVSRSHVLRTRFRFRRNRGCQVPFSCFAHPDSFS